ncbi:hypothetical protein ABZ484_38655, partial [Streptomyces sp. NPDC006393]|uniref:hypothetical protein n=1 Tax=Streptomyces sp. NPDC006393 TaxID=3156763 RepID=UPI0033C9F7A3
RPCCPSVILPGRDRISCQTVHTRTYTNFRTVPTGAGGCYYTCGNGGTNNSGKEESDVQSGGCDSACQQALASLTKKVKGDLYKALAVELQKYVMALGMNTRPCQEGASVTSGTAAACADLMGVGSTKDMNDIVNDWLNGTGGTYVFGAGSKITQQLASNDHNSKILSDLIKVISSADFDISPSKLGKRASYKDPKSNFFKDVQGMLTGGSKGSGLPEAFMGSYTEVYQVVNVDRESRSFTVAFAAYNGTGLGSLLHNPLFPDRAEGRQQGTLRQIYYWTVTVGG